MDIPEAIEIKKHYRYILQDASIPELIEADDLSIVALEAYQKSQANGWYPPGYKLPGETED